MRVPDDHLRRIGFWLPRSGRKALLAEIAADIEESIDAEAERAGRLLTDDEVRAAIRAFGTPPMIATRYGADTPLVGGGFMTAWRRVLTLAIVAVVAIQVLLLVPALAGAETGTHGALVVAAGGRAIVGLLAAFTAVTLVFAAMTRAHRPGRCEGVQR